MITNSKNNDASRDVLLDHNEYTQSSAHFISYPMVPTHSI